MTFLFYVLKLSFFAAEFLSLYIEATYLLVILPFAGAPGRSDEVNGFIIGFNYILALTFFFLHQYSYICVGFKNPGYFGDYFVAENKGVEMVENQNKEAIDAEGAPEMLERTKFDIYEKEAYIKFNQSKRELETNQNDDHFALVPQKLTIVKTVVKVDLKNKDFKGFRYCKKCQNVKPPRTHHCSICGKCVMKMDHHCPWTGNCIGLKNYKYFICFLFWTVVACLHVFISTPLINHNIAWIPRYSNHEFVKQHRFLNPQMVHMLSISVAVGVFLLFFVHLGFLKRNETSVECGDLIMNTNPYKLSPWRSNVEQVLGKRTWLWLSPFHMPEEPIDGLSYPRNAEV